MSHTSEWPRRELGEGLAPPLLSFGAERSSGKRSAGDSEPAEDPAPRGHLQGREEEEKLEVTKGHGGGDSVAASREMGSSCGAGWRRRITRPGSQTPASRQVHAQVQGWLQLQKLSVGEGEDGAGDTGGLMLNKTCVCMGGGESVLREQWQELSYVRGRRVLNQARGCLLVSAQDRR